MPSDIIPSSLEKYEEYFWYRFTLQDLIFALNSGNTWVDPEGITSIDVVPEEYPPPDSITFTDIKDPFSTIGVRTHPEPSPLIIRSGLEKYLLPEFKTITWTILPLLKTGWTCALIPESSVIVGW